MHEWHPSLEGHVWFLSKLGNGMMECLRCFGQIGEKQKVRGSITIFEKMFVEHVRNLWAIPIINAPRIRVRNVGKQEKKLA
jgi:hypothetical protein